MDNASEHVHKLIDDPTTFETIETQYEDTADCYWTLRKEAKQLVSSFDEYMQFYAACIESGPTGLVYSDLNRNAVRSIKNMVLRSSTGGRQFPVASASDLQDRIDAYQELGIDRLTPDSVIFTILEHLFDDDKVAHAYAVIDDLLDDIEAASESLVSLLARARFILFAELRVSTLDGLSRHIERLHSDLPDRRPDDDTPVSDLRAKAEARSYADHEKLALIQTCLARENNFENLEEYLYLSARDVPERYRHDNRKDPWRGELQLARRQFDTILNLFDEQLSADREARVRSYRSVVGGELNSGGRWRSQRDPQDLPDANFLSASKNYLSAAHEIESVDANRYVKYLSQACRHLATGAQQRNLGPSHGWETSRLIHRQATNLLTDIVQSADGSDKILETITGSVALHTFWRHQAAAATAFDRRDPDAIQEAITAAWEHVDNTPTHVDTDFLDALDDLREALVLEDEGEYQAALERYTEVDDGRIDLTQRIALVEIKDHLDSGRYDTAIDQAEAEFGEDSPVTGAVALVSGRYVSSTSIYPPVFDDLRAVDPTVKYPLVFYTYLLSGSPNTENVVIDGINTLLQKL